MAIQQLVINASFFENGTCSYKVLLHGQEVADDGIGIVTTWPELLRELYSASSRWAPEAQKAE